MFHFLDFLSLLCIVHTEFLSGVCVCSSSATAGLLAINSLHVCLRKFLFLLHPSKNVFFWVNSYISVIKVSLHLLAYMVSKKKSAITHIFVPIYLACFFPPFLWLSSEFYLYLCFQQLEYNLCRCVVLCCLVSFYICPS